MTWERDSRRTTPRHEARGYPIPLARDVLVTGCILLTAGAANAHGVLGARFFPATIVTDDPFAADELALPTITAIGRDTEYDLDYSKTILAGFAVSLDAGYADERPANGPDASGFTNLSVTPALELWRSESHEAIITGGFIWEIWGTLPRSRIDICALFSGIDLKR